MSGPRVQLLYFDGCPNYRATLELVERTRRELGIEAELELIEVPDQESAQRLRFLGSPTVRVDGRDIDPSATERGRYALSCRVYRSERGASGQPDPRWLRDALRQGDWGSRQRRTQELSRGEQLVYRALLERFAAGAPPSAADVDAAANKAGFDPARLRETLARLDLVHFGEDGTPLVAYPFSAGSRGHRVRVDGIWVEAMCAIDALGIAPMLERPAETSSRDPASGGVVRVRVGAVGDATFWEPDGAVVVAGRSCCGGPSFQSCCPDHNFFESDSSARRYLKTHPALSAEPLSIPAATEQARAVFGDILKRLAR